MTFCNLMNLMGERLEVNNGVGAPAVVGVQDEVSVEVTSIESGERQPISWIRKALIVFYFFN